MLTRYFERGNIMPLAEFKTMNDKIAVKEVHIYHVDALAQFSQILWNRRELDNFESNPTGTPKLKREKDVIMDSNELKVYPLIKIQFISNVIRLAPTVSLSQIF